MLSTSSAAGDFSRTPRAGGGSRAVLALDGVVEGLVPAVEQHLAEGGGDDQRQDAEAHPEEQASHRRAEEGPPHHHQLLAKIRIAGRDAARRGRLALARARSTSAAAPIRSNLIRHSQTSRARRRHPCAWQVCRTDGNVGIRAGATRRGKPSWSPSSLPASVRVSRRRRTGACMTAMTSVPASSTSAAAPASMACSRLPQLSAPPLSSSTALFVEVFEESAEDGSEVNKVVVPVIYGRASCLAISAFACMS